jgi:hypothetical protein
VEFSNSFFWTTTKSPVLADPSSLELQFILFEECVWPYIPPARGTPFLNMESSERVESSQSGKQRMQVFFLLFSSVSSLFSLLFCYLYFSSSNRHIERAHDETGKSRQIEIRVTSQCSSTRCSSTSTSPSERLQKGSGLCRPLWT